MPAPESSIAQARNLIEQHRLQEAEALLAQAASARPGDLAPLSLLLSLAVDTKDIDAQIRYAELILKLDPERLNERVTLGYAKGLRGAIEDLRNELDGYLSMASRAPFPPEAGQRLLRVIQYADTGRSRVARLARLRGLVEAAERAAALQPQRFGCLLAEIDLALGDYDAFVASVDGLATRYPNARPVGKLRRIAEKIQAPEFPDFMAPKVFGIGLSRTGTTSLNAALQLLGYQAIHWDNPHSRSLIAWDDFFLFDGFTDISVSYQFETLFHTFPNARFIYTRRPLDAWVRSVRTHYFGTRGVRHPADLNIASAKQRFSRRAGPIEMNLYARFASWEEAYAAFDARVRAFFRDKPAGRLLELDICDGEGWPKLCAFLGREVPGVPFPNRNAHALMTLGESGAVASARARVDQAAGNAIGGQQ